PGGRHSGRRAGPRIAGRQVRGHGADRGVQPGLPAAGCRSARGRRGAHRDGGLAEAGAGPKPGARRLPLPAHARARELTGAGHRGGHVRTLGLTDFRSYTSVEVNLSPGLTVLVGPNGEGKTNLLEALAWLATLASFRGAPTGALARRGASFAIVRALAERDGREILLEAQLQPTGRNRVLVNRQPLRRAREMLGSLRV